MHPQPRSGWSFRRLVTDPLAWFFLIWTYYLVRIRYTCAYEPTSYFFRPELAYIPGYSAIRHPQAQAFVDQYSLQPPDATASSSSLSPKLCVGTASVHRDGISYLPTTIGSLQHGLTEVERSSIHFAVLVAHTEPAMHEDFRRPWLAYLADKVLTYDDPDGENPAGYQAWARRLELRGEHNPKARFDYMVVLEECVRSGAEHIMIIEDDVLAVEGWYGRTMEAVAMATEKSMAMGHTGFYYLRLFYYEGLRGWNSESWPTYLTSSVITFACVLTTLLILRTCYRPSRTYLPNHYILLILFLCTPLTIGLIFLAGGNYIFPVPTGVSIMSSFACCGQGLLYHRSHVQDFMIPTLRASIDDVEEEDSTDSWVEKWAEKTGGLRWAVNPVVIQHIGGKSSHGVFRNQYGDFMGGRIHNFGFERYDVEELEAGKNEGLDAAGAGG